MTEMQKEMQKLISKDELDKAFDESFWYIIYSL